MGGLRQADAVHVRRVPGRRARARRASRPSPASSRRTRSSPRRSPRARYGAIALGRRDRRRVPDRRSTRSACSSSSSAASRPPSCSEHLPHARRQGHALGADDGRAGRRASPCSRSSAAGSSSPTVWTPSRTGSTRSAPAARRGDAARRSSSRASVARRARRSSGSAIAWAIYAARRVAAPRVPRRADACSSTSSTSTSSTTRSSTGPRCCSRVALPLRRAAARRSARSASSSRALARPGRPRPPPDGPRPHLRARDRRRRSPSSPSSSWRCAEHGWLTTVLILLPVAGALLALASLPGRRAFAVGLDARSSSRSSRSALDRRGRAVRLLEAPASSSTSRRAGSATSASRTTSASTASRSGSSG